MSKVLTKDYNNKNQSDPKSATSEKFPNEQIYSLHLPTANLLLYHLAISHSRTVTPTSISTCTHIEALKPPLRSQPLTNNLITPLHLAQRGGQWRAKYIRIQRVHLQCVQKYTPKTENGHPLSKTISLLFGLMKHYIFLCHFDVPLRFAHFCRFPLVSCCETFFCYCWCCWHFVSALGVLWW